MFKRILLTLLPILILSSCASPTGTPVPVSPTESTPEAPSFDWWRTAIFYEIFVRSFYDSDANGIGDFNGITQKLGYLESLGITAIWLMPIHPSPSYHGYDVINYYAVNPEYGTMDDFKNLLNEIHERDMHLIIDLVINHTSSEHPWFKDANANLNSPYRDFYLWQDEPGAGNWHQGQNGYYYGYFWEGMPDLNYKNSDVTTEILDITDFWLNEIGVDGFRIDAVKHLIEEDGKVENTPATHEWLKDFYIAYKEQNPQAYTIGEVFGAGSSIVNLYTGDEMDHIFNFEMSSGFVNSTNGEANSGIVSAIKFAQQDMPDFNFATFLTNHDQNRVVSVFNGNINKAKIASFLMLTAPGTPFIYYGEEIGMQGKKPDEDIRLPMQWSDDAFAGFSTVQPWRDPYIDIHNPEFDYTQINVENQTIDSTSLLEHYRSLIELRKTYSALQTGNIILLDTNNSGIYASVQHDANGTFLILVNLTSEEILDYAINLNDANLVESIVSVQTIYGEIEAQGPERSGESFKPYKPFDNLLPYAMFVIKINQ